MSKSFEFLAGRMPVGPFVTVADNGTVLVGVNELEGTPTILSRKCDHLLTARADDDLRARMILVLTNEEARVILRGLQEVVRGTQGDLEKR